MSKNTSMKDFREKFACLRKEISDRIHERDGYPRHNIHVICDVKVDGITVDWDYSGLEDLNLKADSPTVYLKTYTDDYITRVFVKAIFNVEGKPQEHDNELLVPFETYTFTTYEDCLDFFHKVFLEKYPEHAEDSYVWMREKNSDSGIPYIIITHLNDNGLIKETPVQVSDFTTVDAYKLLPETIRKEVNNWICPLKITRADVSIRDLNAVEILVDRKDLADTLYKTDDLTGIVNKYF